MTKLNSILHQELRLSVMSFLAGVESANFKKLMEVTGASKGNLSVQLTKLRDAGYIEIQKSFKGNYPHTECFIQEKGKNELNKYIKQIKNLLNL